MEIDFQTDISYERYHLPRIETKRNEPLIQS